jgi:MFS family permease
MAIGSVLGAFMAAIRSRPTIPLMLVSALIFGAGCALAAVMPDYRLFGLVLILIGVSAQTFTVSANSLVQISTEPAMRGRVLAILMAIFAGGTPIGAPIVGRIADTLGPRWALGAGALAGTAAAAIGLWYMSRPVEPASLAGPPGIRIE